ncbi:LacI family DNA-binding transcriptional regulator [Serinicoccus sediminis]|uniref:LacI family DNA-binding transcriptional regulator n=1 Tax=Serinicoccus sediminis TaxID=2306021 RepID=UPI00101EE576|nr:LacI family DNA-binding transcriptional regulator [Serinicoccus sediminis]
MYDVAAAAGVSHQTVSRVVNNSDQVRPETVDRVRRAMVRLGYRPSGTARNLAVRRTRSLGVVSFMGPLFGPMSMLLSIEAAARRSGYAAQLVSAHGLDAGQVDAVLEEVLRRDVEGVAVIAPTDQQAGMVAGLRDQLPVVAVEGRLGDDVPFVASDNEAGGRLVAEHLLECGHRTIAHVSGPEDWGEARQRTAGWANRLRSAGVEPGPVWAGDWSPESGYRAGVELLAHPRWGEVTAVFAANDSMALGLMAALHRAGAGVPGRVSVIGYDNTPESGWLQPALSTVEQQFDAVGAAAVERLVTSLEGGAAQAELLIPPRLVSRSSVARHGRG